MELHESVTHTNIKKGFLTLEERLLKKHKGKYSYEKAILINKRTKFTITCPDHGDFEQEPDAHLKGQGCPTCAEANKGKTRSDNVAKTWVARASKVHNNKYDYSKFVYTKAHLKATITCPIHGDFIKGINAHMMGQGCPECVHKGYHDEKFYRGKPTILYYIRLFNGLYKIGITSESINKRYSGEFTIDFEVLSQWVYPNGADAFQVEQAILRATHAEKYTGPRVFQKGGNSELRTNDVSSTIHKILKDYYETTN